MPSPFCPTCGGYGGEHFDWHADVLRGEEADRARAKAERAEAEGRPQFAELWRTFGAGCAKAGEAK